jgi:hypothetical protein
MLVGLYLDQLPVFRQLATKVDNRRRQVSLQGHLKAMFNHTLTRHFLAPVAVAVAINLINWDSLVSMGAEDDERVESSLYAVDKGGTLGM